MKLRSYLLLSLLVIALDQVTKYWAEYILRGDVIQVLSWFNFSLAHNTGAAFGFLADHGG